MDELKDSNYQLLTRLIEALSHEIRTPLSVVTNTLSYIDAPNDRDDVKRAHEKAFEIASILSEAALPISENDETDINLQRFFDEALWAFPVTWEKRAGEGIFRADRGALWLLLTEIARTFTENKKAGSELSVSFMGEPVLTLSFSAPFKLPLISEESPQTFEALRKCGANISLVRALRIDILCARFNYSLTTKDAHVFFTLNFRAASP